MKRVHNKNKGSALVLALVIVTVITIICSTILMGAFLQLKFIRNNIHKLQAFYLAEAGIYKTIWYLSGNEGRDPFWRTENETMELFSNQTANVSVKEWGGFLKIVSTADYKNLTKSVRVLVGEIPPAPFQQAIHIGGAGYPLVVTGKNRIIGDVTVGLKGVEKGWIKGQGFEGEKPVQGKISRKQTPKMPLFNAGLFLRAFEKYQNILKNPSGYQLFDTSSVINAELLSQSKENRIHIHGNVEINQPVFANGSQEAMMISCTGNMTVQGHIRIGGPIELVAGGKIQVRDQALLKNCILYADEGIEITDQCQIEGQLLSPGDIILRDQVTLDYPSVIYCSGRLHENTLRGQIALQNMAVVKGTVILNPKIENLRDKRDETSVYVGKNSKLIGVIYSNHYTVLDGTVYGNVSTKEFFLYVSPTTYLNWLRDATVDRSKLPGIFLMPLFFSERPRLNVMNWRED